MDIQRALVAECSVELPRPVILGPVHITARNYVALRLIASDGSYGDAIGYPRTSPLFDAAVQKVQRTLGERVENELGPAKAAADAGIETNASIRADSLISIAKADLTAKQRGLPLYRMLGGERTWLPVMAVAGYYLQERSIEDVGDEVAALTDAGFPLVKVMLDGHDPKFDLNYVTHARQRAGGRLAADAHWSWQNVESAASALSVIDDAGLEFIEDPFPARFNGGLAELSPRLKTPLAAGEDMSGPASLRDLAGSVSVLRVDATTCGGIECAIEAMQSAEQLGAQVLPHVFIPLHAQLAAASPSANFVEIVPPETRSDPIETLLSRPVRIEDGMFLVDQEPGAGFELNWEAVSRIATRVAEFDGE